MTPRHLERRIRIWLILFIIGLAVAGLTAFPLEFELRWLVRSLHGWASPVADAIPSLQRWLEHVQTGLSESYAKYPFLAYGTDWLAFAHLVIAIAFWGPLRDPVRNIWVIEFGMIACVAVIPAVLICGVVRDIPWGWQLVDMSFGVFGIIPLYLVRRLIKRLEVLRESAMMAPAVEQVSHSGLAS
ncbi:hypothetical protein F4553_004539 [Allocatelliglobosispora scoriae]|uniref:Cytoplasmic membrane protein n=1 Tax=Allocatelliglobosispora scoriae TaxID=643052 RepID=A0A841BWP7_9ACTN|nr:hypothetical protein [Allocatelliglobosispora scoriae]MBB5871160.1 hypothetical protein [Allocatelliglobosispora scoriae]